MSLYTVHVKMTAPVSMSEICAKIGRAFDPDTGGDKSFFNVYPAGHSQENPLAPISIATDFWAIPEFAAGLPYLMTDPELLRSSCELDYSTRWQELDAPTLAECEQFCEQVVLKIDELPKGIA